VVRTIYSPTVPRIREGEALLGSVERPGVMCEWVIGDSSAGLDVWGNPAILLRSVAVSPDAVAAALGDAFTPRNRAPRAHTRRRHDGRLGKVRR
jgi:hypothetical protein